MKRISAFTLIELLVTISIIGILAAIALFAAQGAREQGRDAKRKSDLETLRSGLEIFRSDCNQYPANNQFVFGGTLVGDGTPSSCAVANTYIAQIPQDPQYNARQYYYSSTGSTYILCARLENAPNPAVNVTGCGSNCGSGGACNWRVVSP